MKLFERIFLYSVIAILAFHVYLVDERVNSQSSYQHEIVASKKLIVNYEGQPIIGMGSDENGNANIAMYNNSGNLNVAIDTMRGSGRLAIFNNWGSQVVVIHSTTDGKGTLFLSNGGGVSVNNENNNMVVGLGAFNGDGMVVINNKNGEVIGTLP